MRDETAFDQEIDGEWQFRPEGDIRTNMTFYVHSTYKVTSNEHVGGADLVEHLAERTPVVAGGTRRVFTPPASSAFFATLARTLAGSTAAGSRRRIAAGVEEKASNGPAQDTRTTA